MSKVTKFTPGRWCVDGYEIKAECCPIEIAKVTVFNEGKANAHLIAAAPDLHEALVELVAIQECCDETGYVDGEGFVDVEASLEKARAALAKSRGET